MILCVTLNPCLDKTLSVPAWEPGDNVRGRSVREVVGGKGNNVARALARLGRPVRPVTFLGHATGQRCEVLLRQDDGLDPISIASDAPTRIILTVRNEENDAQTAFFDPDPAISESEAAALYEAVESRLREGGVELLTLSGSSPSRATDHLYSDLIALARGRRVPVFLDTYGRALGAIWGFWPDVIQLNRREAADALSRPLEAVTESELLDLLSDWARHGVRVGVVTHGEHAVLALVQNAFYRAMPATVERVVNPIGSGDSLFAGLADGHLSGLGPEELLRHALACAASNVRTWDAGDIQRDEVLATAPSIQVERLERPVPAPVSSGLQRHAPGRKR